MATNLGKSDPYRKMDSGQKNIRPGFLSRGKKGEGGGGGVSGREDDVSKAASDLGSREEESLKSLGQGEDDLAGARERESSPGGLYTGGIGSNGKKKGKGKGFLNKKGPIMIISMVLGTSVMSFFGISTEIIAWKENLTGMFGQNSAVIAGRSNYTMRRLLNTHRGTTSTNIFGNTKFKIGSKLSKKLGENNIDYVETEDADGKSLRLLVYEDENGRRIPIVADDNDIPRANALKKVTIDGAEVELTDSSITLANARKTNKNFAVDYDDATVTFTGKIAGWFDNVVDSMYERIIGKGARNQTDIEDTDEEGVNKLLLGNASEGADDTEVDAQKIKDVDEDGNEIYRDITPEEMDEINSESDRIPITDTIDEDGAKAALGSRAKKAAMMGATVGCAILKGVGAISATIGAIQVINVINYASKYLEIADKIKAGESNDIVTHTALNNLNEPTKVTMYDEDGKGVVVEGSVTEGAGWNAPFSMTNIIDENDPSALAVNRELTNKNALRRVISGDTGVEGGIDWGGAIGAVTSFGAGVAAFRACNAIQGVAGVVSVIADVASFFTMGAAKAVKEIVKGAIKGSALAGAMITIGLVLNAVTPIIARWFVGKLSDVFLGKTGGFALLSGAQNIMNSNLQMSTGRYADKDNAVEVFAFTKDVEREWAAYERAKRSPFDATSKYTFLGVIYNSILPIINTSSGTVASVVSSVANLTKNSTVALISPSASAASETAEFEASLASEGNCSYLDSVGVAGDFACNKYAGAYVKEINTLDPETVYKFLESDGSFDGESSDGNPKINPDSDYAKYVVACVASDTQPGTMNGAVQGFLNGVQKDIYDTSTVASGLVNFGRNFVPFEGALDFVESIEEEVAIKWNSGLACTGNTDDPAFNEKIKNFSMYNLDQRVLYNMGVIESNSTVSFLEDYYKENPLDYSFEGQIARVSGLSKEEVNDTLALIEYYDFVTNYDSLARYTFGAPVVEEPNEILFDNDNVVAENTYIILLNEISFADVRNRSFVV